jgi:hypothetical protein
VALRSYCCSAQVTGQPTKRVVAVTRPSLNTRRKNATPVGAVGKKSGEAADSASLTYWVNESVPDLGSILEPHGIDAVAFANWLSPILGDYRAVAKAKSDWPAKADIEKDLVALRDDMLAARRRINPISGHSHAQIASQALPQGVDTHALIGRLRHDLQTLATLALAAQHSLKAAPEAKRGPKGTLHRDMLLKQVVERLTPFVSATLAGQLAHEALTRCGVQVPAEVRGQRRATKRPERKGR